MMDPTRTRAGFLAKNVQPIGFRGPMVPTRLGRRNLDREGAEMTRFERRYAFLLLAAMLVVGRPVGADDPGDLKIWEVLGERTKFDFNQTPLEDVGQYFSDLHGIGIYLDTEAFEKAGVTYKSLALTHQAANVRLWQGLRDLLKPAKLSFMIKNHTLTITTADAAKEWQKKNIGEDEQP
jgi:hypothetical protein